MVAWFFLWKKRGFSKTSHFEVKIDFGCDVDANLVPFWKDFGRPAGSGRLLGPLGSFLGLLRAI